MRPIFCDAWRGVPNRSPDDRFVGFEASWTSSLEIRHVPHGNRGKHFHRLNDDGSFWDERDRKLELAREKRRYRQRLAQTARLVTLSNVGSGTFDY